MIIETPSADWTRAAGTNLADASFPSRIATTTLPTGGAVITWKSRAEAGAGLAPNSLHFKIIGTGAAASTLQIRMWGWRLLAGTGVDTIYDPTLLLELDAVLSTSVGVAGSAILSTERKAHTITATSGFTLPDWCSVHSRTDNIDGHVICDALGFPLIEWVVGLGTATAANILYARL